MIKVGIFYEVYEEDAFILHNLCNYKIVGKSKRVGFPINSLNNVISNLKNKKINYIVVDNDIVKERFNKNSYDDFTYYDRSNVDRINDINKKLLGLKDEYSIKYLLDKIEEIL